MIKKLYEIESELYPHLEKMMENINSLNTMHIDYHEPFVNRIWFQYDEKHRVYLHKIFPSQSSEAALFHPHPWKSAIRIIWGSYEMGVGHSETNEVPKIDCKLHLPQYTTYEMVEENGWHYVNPRIPSYSLMVTGELNSRQMPIEPRKEFRKLTEEEITDILDVCMEFYCRS